MCQKNSVEFSKVDEQNIEYEIDEINGTEILIPKWFSPNGDGVNDHFFLRYSDSLSPLSNATFKFTAKCGKIYEATGVSSYWDGSLPNGKKCLSGSYDYIIDVTWVDGLKRKYTGSIDLYNE